MIDLNKFAKEVHENARAHGWWDTERSFGEVIALIHSELSEALEEYRNGHTPTETYYSEGGKPEGIPSELADVVIRVLDWCGHGGRELFCRDFDTILKPEFADSLEYVKQKDFGTFIADIHRGVSDFYSSDSEEPETFLNNLFAWCASHKIDLESALLEKHNFNKTRPYKHGGEVI